MLGQEQEFRLSEQVKEPEFFTMMTQLPKAQVLDQVSRLPPYAEKLIFDCLENIYSYVTQRNFVEGTPTFFMHTSASVFYESSTKVLIKGKDHAKKAANILQMIHGVLDQLKLKLNHQLHEHQKNTLAQFIKLFESHAILFQIALNTISEVTKDHIQEHHGVKFSDKPVPLVLSPQKKAAVRNSYHEVAPLPRTPKKLSDADRQTLNKFAQRKAAQAIKYEESDEASSASSEFSEEGYSSEDELEKMLRTQVDGMLMGFRLSLETKPEETPEAYSSAKKGKKRQHKY